MKKRLFSFGVYKEIFRRLMGIGIALAALMLLLGMIHVFWLFPGVVYEPGYVSDTVYLLEPNGFMSLLLLPLYVFGIVAVSRAFSFLRKRPGTDFYLSMPVSRTVYYVSASLAIATWMLAVAVAGCLGVCVSSLITGALFNYALLLPMLLTILSTCALIVSVSLISASITGTALMYLLGVIIILFLPRMIFSLVGAALNNVGALLGNSSELFVLFDYSYNVPATLPYGLLFGRFNDDYYINIAASVYTLVHAAILWFIGMLLYKKRKAEAADTPAATAFHQAFFRCACGLPVLVVIPYMLFETFYNTVYYGDAIILLAVSLVMFIGYELLSSRSIKNLIKVLPTYGICIGIAVIMSLTLTALKNFDAGREFTADDISWFSIKSDDGYSTSSYLTLSLEAIRFTDDELKTYIAEGIKTDNPVDGNSIYDITATVQLKNGRSFTTAVYFELDEALGFMKLLRENKDYSELTSYRPELSDISAALIDERLTNEQKQAVIESFIEECGTLPENEIASINIHGMDFGLFGEGDSSAIWAIPSEKSDAAVGIIVDNSEGAIQGEPNKVLLGKLIEPYVQILSIYGTHGYDYCIQQYYLDDTFRETSMLYMQFIREWHENEYETYEYSYFISFTQMVDILMKAPEFHYFRLVLDLSVFAETYGYAPRYELYLDSYRLAEKTGNPNPEYAPVKLNPEYAEILSRAEFSTDPTDYIKINISMLVNGLGDYDMPEAYLKLSKADLARLVELLKEDSEVMYTEYID
ncbi:MAG: hypothetical protein IJA35_07755 [Clostridia bacterium]|nr:hypothetical protein [Clostridia bacterium]